MDASELVRQRVFDPIRRILHWWIGASVMALTALAWMEKALEVGSFKRSITDVHIASGFALTLGLLLRIVWGLIGPEQARFKTLWNSIKTLPANRSEADDEKFGYGRIASLAYAFFYLTTAGAILSGLLLSGIRYDQGPFAALLFDDFVWHELILALHYVSLYAATLFIFVHVAGMIRHERISGAPAAQSMISGYQYRVVKRNRGES